jgi:hypothetical protein
VLRQNTGQFQQGVRSKRIFFNREKADGMNRDGIEPRRTIWALAEVSWQDATGTSCRAPATMEDTSASGACVRISAAIDVGSNLTIKWHREQFSGVARNRRRDGNEFLVGVQRNKANNHMRTDPPLKENALVGQVAALASCAAAECIPAGVSKNHGAPVPPPTAVVTSSPTLSSTNPCDAVPKQDTNPDKPPANSSETKALPEKASSVPVVKQLSARSSSGVRADDQNSSSLGAVPKPKLQTKDSPRQERKVMQSTPLFRKFWQHEPNPADGPDNATSTEVPVNKSDINTAEGLPNPQGGLLSCEDIYRASGILGGRSKYDITKIVEMLNSKHIRELPKEVKRSAVLMALDAAGTPVDEVLNDATRRQHALNNYEAGQQKQFEQFEAAKLRENAQIKSEMERITVHYAERIQKNLDQVAHEREAFRNWQAMKEQESQRIAEAVGLCGKQPAVDPSHDAPTALAKGAAASSSAATGSVNPPAERAN